MFGIPQLTAQTVAKLMRVRHINQSHDNFAVLCELNAEAEKKNETMD
jgi:hypothetical protein